MSLRDSLSCVCEWSLVNADTMCYQTIVSVFSIYYMLISLFIWMSQCQLLYTKDVLCMKCIYVCMSFSVYFILVRTIYVLVFLFALDRKVSIILTNGCTFRRRKIWAFTERSSLCQFGHPPWKQRCFTILVVSCDAVV